MSFADAIKTCLAKYTDFSGRARRSEYWFFYLFIIIVMIAASVIDGVLDTAPVLYLLAVLALILPVVAAGVRRMHDTGRSGWWMLVGLIPLVGGIVLIVLAAQDSVPDNEYGPNPKGAIGYGTPPA